MKRYFFALTALAAVAFACGVDAASLAEEVMKASFKDRGQAKVDRLNQDETQAACSTPSGKVSKEVAAKIQAINLKAIKYPADGKLLGDWKEGEKIAQSGVGKQFSDNPANPSGGNCYACHQLSKAEISYGTIGPSLYNFGKLRGFTEANRKYAYGKIYNAQAYSACSNMPRFGHNQILTEDQIRHVTALLMDPESPVNK
ncbi:MAG TPA: sulfur oxidation c-type cytochrome SoxX [Usitatibacteraceae bacterium]|nr:sulfur oxidation c-type cytochrome SoxX [Usitatibacteraceae bacterium]